MDARTREALEASIEKWKANAATAMPTVVRLGVGDCPLCRLFNREGNDCAGCPVHERTKAAFCDNSPYVHAFRTWLVWRDLPDNALAAAEFHAAAQDEVDFLTSLLEPAQ